MGGAETERCQEEDHFTRLDSDPSGSPGSGRSRKLTTAELWRNVRRLWKGSRRRLTLVSSGRPRGAQRTHSSCCCGTVLGSVSSTR